MKNWSQRVCNLFLRQFHGSILINFYVIIVCGKRYERYEYFIIIILRCNREFFAVRSYLLLFSNSTVQLVRLIGNTSTYSYNMVSYDEEAHPTEAPDECWKPHWWTFSLIYLLLIWRDASWVRWRNNLQVHAVSCTSAVRINCFVLMFPYGAGM